MSYSAESYETHMVPPLFAPWASYLAKSAAPQLGERVLDVACGAGVVARNVASRVGLNGMIIGIDLDPDMLATAWAVATQMDLAIEWTQGRAEKLPFPDASFDPVLCQFGCRFSASYRPLMSRYQGGRISDSENAKGLVRAPRGSTMRAGFID